MNRYEEKQEARRARLLARAEKLRTEGERRVSNAKRISDFIPMGQPILVGHHSEKRHRRDLARIDANFSKGFAAINAADDLERRAANVGAGGISSDDPDAIDKLNAKIADLERFQDLAKNANKCVRKNDRDGLRALGFSDARIEQLFTPDFCGRLGFPSYVTSNNNANIRRLKERVQHLTQLRALEPIDVEGMGWRLYDDVDENRLCIRFDDIPDEAMRRDLKAHGFKWARSRGEWVRMRSNAATYHAKRILGFSEGGAHNG